MEAGRVSLESRINALEHLVQLALARGAAVTDLSPGNQSLDAFHRQRVSQPLALFSSKLLYDAQPIVWDDQQTSGGGTSSTFLANQAAVQMAVAGNVAGTRVRQSFQRLNYQPGKSQLFLGTGVLVAEGAPGVAGVVRRIGQFDQDNGYFFQASGALGAAAVVVRSSVSGAPVDTVIPQASWNLDKMDGTGPSGITLDLSKIQIFVIDYQWLSAGQIRFGFDGPGRITYVNLGQPPFLTNVPFGFNIAGDPSVVVLAIQEFAGPTTFSGSFNWREQT